MTSERPLMTGLFPDRESAEHGYNSWPIAAIPKTTSTS